MPAAAADKQILMMSFRLVLSLTDRAPDEWPPVLASICGLNRLVPSDVFNRSYTCSKHTEHIYLFFAADIIDPIHIYKVDDIYMICSPET